MLVKYLIFFLSFSSVQAMNLTNELIKFLSKEYSLKKKILKLLFILH